MGDNYHLEELRIARDPTRKGNILPPPKAPRDRILDIGCGAGQTLLAAYPDRPSFGLDPDLTALQLGKTLAPSISLLCGTAEALPYRDGSFDFVIARVSLPYTNIPVAIAEMRRVLKKDGELWVTLHPLWIPWRNARISRSLKAWVFFGYTVLNGLIFHFFQREFSFAGRYESFQTVKGMTRCLERNCFKPTLISNDYTFLITAKAI